MPHFTCLKPVGDYNYQCYLAARNPGEKSIYSKTVRHLLPLVSIPMSNSSEAREATCVNSIGSPGE